MDSDSSGATSRPAWWQLGAEVLLVDSLTPDYGGNLFNIAPIRDSGAGQHLGRAGCQLDAASGAGPAGHLQSRGASEPRRQHARPVYRPRDQLPEPVVDSGSLPASHIPSVKVVFAGTRQLYGKPDALPVTEEHLVRPIDVNGINKAAGEYYHLVYNNVFGVRSCSLRLTNVYGPRQLMRHNRQGFIGWFIRLAVEDREIQLFGDGSQRRDFVYVDDAVDAFLRAGASDACNGEVFNVGGSGPVSLGELATLLVEVAGTGRVRFVDWPAERRAIDIGDFYADSSKFKRAVGWSGRVALRDGLTRTVAYYRDHLSEYIDAPLDAPAEAP